MAKVFKILGLFVFLLSFSLSTASSNSLNKEMDHLIEYINNSDCIFIRNGVEHTPEEAVQHILRKYDYFQKKITKTEDFIEFCATKSTITKRYYEISCGGKSRIRSREWLLDELKRFRNK